MIEIYNLYLPKSRREVTIEISAPRFKNNITFDLLFFLDGQNAFKDSHASFGRSIRATKYISFAAREMNKRIIGVAIYNSGSEMGRINEYCPFPMINAAQKEWLKHDVNECYKFCDDLVNTIVPFIEKKYKSSGNRFIYGSSLAALTALYIGFKYKDAFNYIGAFSTASFLCEDDLLNFIKESNYNKNVYLYVGKNETSDDIYDKNLYLNASLKIYNLLKEKNQRARLSIDANGTHNEATWDKHFMEFINFIYNDDIFYSF